MPKKFRRNHNIGHVKKSKAYTVEEICECLNVHSHTVYAWLKHGLQPIKGHYPKLVHGSVLVAFLSEQRAARKVKCAPDEFYCCKCRAARKPENGSVTPKQKSQKIINLRAVCSVCSSKIFKSISAQNSPQTILQPQPQ